MPIIKLQSFDGKIFDTDIEIVKCSGTIKTMLERCGMEDDENTIVPLPNVSSTILRKVLEWARYHKNDPKPKEDDESKNRPMPKEGYESKVERTDDIMPWDADFLKVDQGTFFELTMAANYLNIKGLQELTCKTLANMIKGKTPEEIRLTLNIKKEITPDEEEQLRNENEWSEEVEVYRPNPHD
nr:S-phase kinase-associated protein 1-like [Drosophila bipectinata]